MSNHPLVQVDLAALEQAQNSLTDGKPTDIYKVEASKIFMVPEADVTPQQREYAKRQAYVMIYGLVR